MLKSKPYSFGGFFRPYLFLYAVLIAACALAGINYPARSAHAAEAAKPPKVHAVRPVSDFKIVLPHSDVSRIFENNKMVMIDYSELTELIEKNNALVKEQSPGIKKDKKTPPADYIISSASYKFMKDRENVLCSADIDISILAEGKFVLIPLFSGEMAMNDAVIDDTVPVMIVEPASGDNAEMIQQAVERQAVEARQQYQQYQQINAAEAFTANNMNPAANVRAARKNSGNRYSLLLKGKGQHLLTIRFILTPQKDNSTYSFAINVPRSPKNSSVFLHDEKNAVIKMTPAIGPKLFLHPETRNQALEASFGFCDSLAFTYFGITGEEKKMMDDLAKKETDRLKTPETASETAEIAVKETAEVEIAAEEAPLVSSSVKTVYSFGDGLLRGNHEVSFNIIKGKISKFSIELPAGTEVEDVLSDNYDKRTIQESKFHSSIEIFLKTPAAEDFTINLTSITRLEEGKYEVMLPELTVHNMESERGHIAICALTNIRITLAGDPVNLERIDAQELPDRIKFAIVSPILYGFKYFKHPYGAKFSLTRYSDSRVLSSLINNSAISTFITNQGRVISNCEFDLKNNGLPFLKMTPDETVEIFDAIVNNALVKASYDSESNLKIPVIKSIISDRDVLGFPVKFKISSSAEPLSAMGRIKLQVPKIDLPVMAFKWRVYTPEGYVFYNMGGAPNLKEQPAVPLIYQVPAAAVNAVIAIVNSEEALAVTMGIIIVLVVLFAIYLCYVGGAKVYKSDLIPFIWNLFTGILSGGLSFLRGNAAAIFIVIAICGILAAIATPNFNRARSQSKTKSCYSNLSTIDGAVELFRMENKSTDEFQNSPDPLQYLMNKGYLKSRPRCPEGYDYTLDPNKAQAGKFEFYCQRHGSYGAPASDDRRQSINAEMTASAPPPPAAMPQSAGAPLESMAGKMSMEEQDANERMDSGRLMSKSEAKKDMFESKPYKKSRLEKAKISKPSPTAASEKGIYSVPIKLPVTSHSSAISRQFIMPSENVWLDVSYMSVKVYRALAGVLALIALLLPVVLVRALERGSIVLWLCGGAMIGVLEYANSVLPQIARSVNIGLITGIAIFLALKIIAALSDPGNIQKIIDRFTPPPQPPADGSQTPATPGTGVVPLLILFTLASLLLGTQAAVAAEAKEKIDRIEYIQSTREIQTFYLFNNLTGADSKLNQKVVFMPYNDLQYLIDSVNAMRHVDTSEDLVQMPPYRTLIKKINISGKVDTETAALDMEYFIDVFDDNYNAVDLISGNIAVSSIDSYLIKPFNYGFYEISPRYIDKLEYFYKSDAERKKISQYRSNKPFDRVGEYRSMKFNVNEQNYSAMFEDPGEYLVKVSIKTNVVFSDNSYYFDFMPKKAPCMKADIKTPSEYDILADNLIIESQSRDSVSNEITTRASLIPADSYRFRLTLAEEVRRERQKKQQEEEERQRVAREQMRLKMQKTDEVRVITRKFDPRVTLTSCQRLTIDEERFYSTINLDYFIQNTEIRELKFSVPQQMMIAQVETPGNASDWKLANSETPGEKTLTVTFRLPRQGRLRMKIKFENEIANMKLAVDAPWLVPQNVSEHKGYIAVDSAINAEIATTGEVSAALVPVDEKEIPSLPQGYASSPVLYSYKFTKRPQNLSFIIKKHTDIASIPCAIDTAGYKTFITREGYAITKACYQVRNNNVQFLEVKMPAGSTPWSLKVGEKLFKPGSGPNGSIFIPLLKSPLEGQEFKAFSVEFVFLTKLDPYKTLGNSRFELPRISVICSKLEWEVHFIDNYNQVNIKTNMRQDKLKTAGQFLGSTAAQTISMDQILNMQSEKMRTSNAGIYNTQGYVEPARDSSSMLPFGGSLRGMLPVPIEVPSTSNAMYFSVESLEKIDNIDDATMFYIEFTYYSKTVFELFAFIGYLLGIFTTFLLYGAAFKARFKSFAMGAFVPAVYVGVLEYTSPNTFQYFFLGVAMAVVIAIAYRIVRLNDSERRLLKLK